MYVVIALLVALCLSPYYHRAATAEECGTRFIDFTSSVVLAQVVLQGSVKDFNPSHSANRLRSANVSMANVYKGMDVLKNSGSMDGTERNILVQSFGSEDKALCVASDAETTMGKEMVFFLRQSSDRRMMEHSALPHPAQGNEGLRVRRSLCDTCIRPPTIRRLVCKNCAKQPHIKPMKSKKATMGRRARLRCVARGKPAPKLSWFKGQVPVMSGNGGVTIRTTALTSTLIFTRTTSAHSGQYRCSASNELGEAEEVTTLEIHKKPKRKQKEPTDVSVKDASDKVQCRANPCTNGGTCFFSPSLNLRQCVCRSGFEGVTCENVLSSAVIQDNMTNEQGTTRTQNSRSRSHVERETEETRNVVNTQTSPSTLPTTTTTTRLPEHKRAPQVSTRVPITNFDRPIRPQTSNNDISPTLHRSRSSFVPPSRSSLVRPSNSRPSSHYSANGQKLSNYPVRRKSSLKIIPCREKNYCLNKGKCRYISKLNRKFCQCRKGYAGIRCERELRS